jgi:hypothetical protein
MVIKNPLKFHKYAFAWENYLLLARAIRAAFLVRKILKEVGDGKSASPYLASSLKAVNQMYLPPQSGWRISDPKKIALFANFVVGFPVPWGKCVQRSLIAYRLLNGYGVPAKICFGVSREESSDEGHAWVIRLGAPEQAIGEQFDPRERFKLVYISPMPQ